MAFIGMRSSVLLIVLFGNVNRASPYPTQYPPDWRDAPGSLSDFPVAQVDNKTVTIIDPWIYQQRLGIFKTVVQRTQKYFTPWGYNNTGNLLWGLPLQFGWQMSSGRLRDMDGERCAESCIAPNSWWADMNYFLSVLPFLGSLKAGTFSPLKFPVYINKPNHVSAKVKAKFCTSIQECSVRHSEVILHWSQFFEKVSNSSYHSLITRRDQDAVVTLLWRAHTTSLHHALPLFSDELALMSIPEQNFGKGWAMLVDFIAATHYETNLNNTATQQADLPQRLLNSRDIPPFIRDLTVEQNRALLAINLIYDSNTATKGVVLRLWRRAMCSPAGRATGRNLLEKMLKDPAIIPEKLIQLLWDMIIYRCLIPLKDEQATSR